MIRGMNWWCHAAALVDADGGAHWMAEEERFTRHRHARRKFLATVASASLRWRSKIVVRGLERLAVRLST